jgi:hypothetical protein
MTNYTPLTNTGLIKLTCVFVLICFAALTNPASAQQKEKVIYFLAGLKDHVGPDGTGRHETRRDLLVLQRCIDSIANVTGVKIKTKFLYGRTALDIEDMKGVDALIIESSSEASSKERTSPLFPYDKGNLKGYDKQTVAYLNQVDSLQKAGMGIMVLHWGIQTNNEKARSYSLKWFGQTTIEGYTHNPLGYWTVTPVKSSEKHPILRGVKPFMYKDEIFSNLLVKPMDPYRTDLLIGEAANTNQGVIAPGVIASSYEKNGARGILWGGMDYHSAFLNENYLRFVLNAIVWTAGIDVPKGGVKTNAKGLQISPNKPDSFDKLKPANFETFNKK